MKFICSNGKKKMGNRIIYVYDNDTEVDRVNYDICSGYRRIESMEAVSVEVVRKRFEELKPKGYRLELDRKCDGTKAKLPQEIRNRLIELTNN